VNDSYSPTHAVESLADTASIGVVLTDALWAEWHDLAARVGRHVAARPEYSRGSVRLRRSRRPLLVTVHRGNRLVALAPLLVRRYGPLRVARVTGDSLGMIGEILSEDARAVDALWSALAAQRIGIHLAAMDGRDPSVAYVTTSPKWRSTVGDSAAVTVVDVPSCGPGAIGLRSRGARRRLRSTRRDYVDAGTPISVEFLTSAAELDKNWDDMTRLSAVAVEGHDRTDYLAPPVGDLVRSVLDAEADAGRLVVARLTIGDVGVGQLFMVRSDATLEGWLTHYDPAYSDAQPGHQMLEALLDRAREIGVDRIDLGVGTTGFKQAWATGEYRAVRMTALPADLPGAARLLPVVERLECLSLRAAVRRCLTELTALPRRVSHR
jgi:CelD/BcsL family acetyltransferase involved in cellulose biosynthesis